MATYSDLYNLREHFLARATIAVLKIADYILTAEAPATENHANAVKWEATFTSRGNVLTTELNSLATVTWKGPGTEIDNGTNLDMWGKCELNLEYATAPAAGGSVLLAMVTAPDGTNYDDESSAEDPGAHNIIAQVQIIASADPKRYMT